MLAASIIISNLLMSGYFLLEVSAILALQASTPVHLPQPARRSKLDPRKICVLELREDGTILLNQQPISEADLPHRLREVAHGRRVLLRVDKEVRYEKTRQFLDTIGASGPSNVTFVVVDREQDSTPSGRRQSQ